MHLSDKPNMDIFKTVRSAVTILAMGLSVFGLAYCAEKGSMVCGGSYDAARTKTTDSSHLPICYLSVQVCQREA
jgi:hypothetical protein